MADLSTLLAAEGLRVREFLYGASLFVQSQNTLSAGLRETILHLADAPFSVQSNVVIISIGGALVKTQIRIDSIRIEQQQGQPHRCSFVTDTVAPTAGQEIKIGLGDLFLPNLLFAGSIVSVAQRYEGKPENVAWDCECIDYTWLLNRRRPYGTFTGSASTIAQALINSFALGFTTIHVQPSLPVVTIVFDGSEDFQACLGELAKLINGYWYVDYARDLHFFTAESTDLPALLDGTGRDLQLDPPVTLDTDLRQLRTRSNVEGNGSRVLAPIAIGETLIPLESLALYSSSGGSVIHAGQVLTYTSKSQASPSDVLAALATLGSGLNTGNYVYGYTFVTGSGESLPSPLTNMTTSTQTNPTAIGSIVEATGGAGGLINGSTYQWAYTFYRASDGAETTTSPADSLTMTASFRQCQITLSGCQTAPSGWVRRWYRTVAGGSTFKIVNGAVGESGGFFFDSTTDSTLGAAAPGSNPNLNQGTLSSIAVGPSGTTQRKVYRTVVGGAQLKLVTTLADNTTTTYVDSTADGSLGANAPTTDTSGLVVFGLTTTSGSTSSGATTINVVSASSFQSTGGWALIGTSGIAIRYTGTGATTLTGVPATGNGSVTATIPSGTLIQGIGMLIGVPASGIGSVVTALTIGDVLNLFVQRNDVPAQVAMAAVDGGDGIYEVHLQDETLTSVAQCQIRADADLARYSTSIQTLHYATRDRKTRVGKLVSVALPSPTSINGAFTIQRVTIDQIDVAGGHQLGPRYTVEASRVLLTVDAWLQQFQVKAA